MIQLTYVFGKQSQCSRWHTSTCRDRAGMCPCWSTLLLGEIFQSHPRHRTRRDRSDTFVPNKADYLSMGPSTRISLGRRFGCSCRARCTHSGTTDTVSKFEQRSAQERHSVAAALKSSFNTTCLRILWFGAAARKFRAALLLETSAENTNEDNKRCV